MNTKTLNFPEYLILKPYMKYLVFRPKYYGGIYRLLKKMNKGFLPPNSPAINVDLNCKLSNMKGPKTIFAFRTHTHKHGTVVSGYLYRNGRIREFARHDPQEPQMFYPMEKELAIVNGDYLTARCTYNTTAEGRMVFFGTFGRFHINQENKKENK